MTLLNLIYSLTFEPTKFQTEYVEYTVASLEFREALNVIITLYSPVLLGLLLWYIWRELKRLSYVEAYWSVRLAIAFCCIFAGELIRSATIWVILHNKGVQGTYASDIVPLILSLILLIIGFACAIRVMSPARVKHWIWTISTTVVAVVLYLNWAYW